MPDECFKKNPWIFDEEKNFYHLNDIDKVNEIINFRGMVDSHFGSMISPAYVDLREWSVGIISCNKEDAENYMLGNLFEVLADRYKEHAYALPAKSYSKKNRNKTPEFDIFSPALVAHLYLSIENINIVRRGMISLYGQAYFIFPESREFCYLNVCDEYHMIAGQKEILMESLGADFFSTWKSAIAISGFGSSSEMDIIRAARSYGYI